MNEDLLLVNKCKEGDISAFEMLYKKYAPRMKGVVYRYTGNEQMAEDILQDAFVKVYLNIKMYEHTNSFAAWVTRIMINTAINNYHKLKKESLQLLEFSYTNSGGDIDETNEANEFSLEDIVDAITKLPVGYKQVFNLYAIDGYSHKEIAELLMVTEGTSKSQLFKARTFLKKELENKKQIISK